MMNVLASPLLRGFRRLMVLAAVFSCSAHAATYHGVWDPPFGAPFTNLGWRGTSEYFVPDSCVPAGTGFVLNLPYFPGCGGDAVVTSAQVQFYDVTAGGQPTIATLVFDPSSFYIGLLQYTGGALSQLLTNYSNLVNPGEDLSAFGVSGSTEFSLIFTLDGPRLGWRDCGYTSYSASHYTHPSCTFGVNSDAEGFRPEFTITRVPEPGTLALAFLGLLAVAPRRVRALLSRSR